MLLEINADRLVGGKVNDGKIGGAENESDCLDERKNEKRHVPRLDGGLIEKNGLVLLGRGVFAYYERTEKKPEGENRGVFIGIEIRSR